MGEKEISQFYFVKIYSLSEQKITLQTSTKYSYFCDQEYQILVIDDINKLLIVKCNIFFANLIS